MKKIIYLSSLFVVTIVCCMIGIFHHDKKEIKKHGHSGFNLVFNSKDEDSDSDPGNIEMSLEAFDNIVLNGNVMTVTIETGNSYNIYCDYSREELMPDINIKNSTLYIEQDIPGKVRGNNNCDVFIEVPKDKILNSTRIEVDVGNTELCDFECDKVSVNTDVGEVYVRNVNFNDIDITTDVGEIEINTVDDYADYSYNLSTDVGEILVGKTKYKHSYKTNDKNIKRIKVSSDVGGIKIN